MNRGDAESLKAMWEYIKSRFGAHAEPRNGVFPIWLHDDVWCLHEHPSPRFTLDDLDWMVRSRESCGWGLVQGFHNTIEYRFDEELNRYVMELRFWEELRNLSIRHLNIDLEKPGDVRLVVWHKREGTELTIEPTRLCSNRRMGLKPNGEFVRRTDCLDDYFNIRLWFVDITLKGSEHLTRHLYVAYKVWEKDEQQQTQEVTKA